MSIPPPMMPRGEASRACCGGFDEQNNLGLDAGHFGSPERVQAEEPQAERPTVMVSMLHGKRQKRSPPGIGVQMARIAR